ncbi:type I-G CRISPR-associated protein, Cas3-extension family [Actinomadura violacea]|uniref:Uncharacterized protein n=1 Tax=Actinomadura violacea TaxID=2819934 RepID=A0ABS3S8A2_9ACTN|nr:hypothetical protein [Actinomadura violacea]MBO2465224.1 hypothetical protein [Actinomadura violacea]
MTTIELSALDGRDPLGFLAVLGMHRLLTDETDAPIKLSFSDSTGNALLHSDLESIDAITEVLAGIVARAKDTTAIVDVDDRFPLAKPSKSGAAARETLGQKDPMRVPREQYPALAARIADLGSEAEHWFHCLVTDLAIDEQQRAALTPFCAPVGQQSLRSFFMNPLQEVRKDPSYLKEALTAWRRVDKFTGEYLDHRVVRSAADHPHGKSTEAGVPGATWLATQALRLFKLSGNGDTVTSTLWHRRPRHNLMIWPLWTEPLDLHAVQGLLEHPDINSTPNRKLLRTMTIFALAAAERTQLRGPKSARVLTPATTNW